MTMKRHEHVRASNIAKETKKLTTRPATSFPSAAHLYRCDSRAPLDKPLKDTEVYSASWDFAGEGDSLAFVNTCDAPLGVYLLDSVPWTSLILWSVGWLCLQAYSSIAGDDQYASGSSRQLQY